MSIRGRTAAWPVAALAFGALLLGPTGAAARQGHMRNALDHLKQARSTVKSAKFTDSGHRQRALDAIERAIKQVNMGIEAGREDDD